MSTAFSKVVSGVIAALAANPPVCPTKAIYRARAVEMPDQDNEAVSVQWEQGLPQLATITGAPIDWQTRITVECFARSAAVGATGDVVVDPLLQRVYERLAADPSLGGLVDDLVIAGIEAENTVEGKKTGWVRMTYLASHRTDNLTLS
ncbi:hypothetical protein [Massilia yuzhufengensis]|uniref:Uncharacterized protein n=1 Tax=Massilia yuzhufengensis TaxID=1164594 RepID=A0A1I1VKU8_9BURK|nr:hypothetical protein [Massilia yuzhufengensis]SFD83405.1 hypothetical protein SAMN05216204_14017 [Massilia yuzhufengensis]